MCCDACGLAKSASHKYTDAEAGTLAHAWCHKMQHFLNNAVSAGWPEAELKLGDVDAYREPSEFTTMLSTLGHCPAVYRRGADIRKLFRGSG